MSWETQKRKLTKSELFVEIKTEISVLETLCELYDNGKYEMTSKIASSIVGLMLNSGRDREKSSPINSFGKSPQFLTTIRPISYDNYLVEHPGVILSVTYRESGSRPEFIPRFKSESPDNFKEWVAQKSWWESPIIKTDKQSGDKTVNRWKLLKMYRDTRSGSHIDPTIEAIFEHINGSVGWIFVDEFRETITPRMTIAQAAVRQVAFEALHTLNRFQNEVNLN